MKQLSGADSMFLQFEHGNNFMHVASLAIYDPSTAPGGGVRFKDILSFFSARIEQFPQFRRRLVTVPLSLDRPYWIEDPTFDVEFHVRHIALPHPGDWRQLCIQVARLHSRPLDMKRPLWEAYIIEGLDNIPNLPTGSFAVYTKMHHSLVDGAGGQSFMAALHDLEPVPPRVDEDRDPPARFGDLQPTDVRLLGKALLRTVPRVVDGVKSTAGTLGGLASMLKRIVTDELPPAQMVSPKTRFDRPVGHNRVFEAREFLLDDIKALKNAAGVTVNDISVAIVAGAMRQYLLAHNELPEESLSASMPVNMRSRVGETQDNNQIGSITSPLHTNIADPIERLQAIKKSLDEAKAYIDTPLAAVVRLPGALPPVLAKPLARAYVRNKLTRYLPMGQATVITNVPGPPFDLYCAGAKMVCYYPLGLIMPGVGLFQAIFSCSGKAAFTITADRDQMPDPEFYRECLQASYEELRKALLGTGAAKAAKPKALKAKPKAVKTKPKTIKAKAVATMPAKVKHSKAKAMKSKRTKTEAAPSRRTVKRKPTAR